MSSVSYPVYQEPEPTFEERLQTAYERGRTDERAEIRNEVQHWGYDWSHDPVVSGVQHVLNWLDERDKRYGSTR